MAIAAPKCGYGEYSLESIKKIFLTAYSGYKAIKFTTFEVDRNFKCVLHTDNWGCGAFGGSHHLMAILQILAARCVQLDKVIYHAYSNKFKGYVEESLDILENIIKQEPDKNQVNIENCLLNVFNQKFMWNRSDGN